MEELTQIQRRILGAIRERSARGEAPPTYRDLCTEFGWASTGTARDHLRALARKGHVELGDGRARHVRLTSGATDESVRLTVSGQVTAGLPVEVDAVDLGSIAALPEWGPSSTLLALRVSGESMRDAGILSGDIVVARRTPEARDRDIVIATVRGETTLKLLHVDESGIYLVPRNPEFETLRVVDDDFAIVGVVIGLLRTITRSSPSIPAAPDSPETQR